MAICGCAVAICGCAVTNWGCPAAIEGKWTGSEKVGGRVCITVWPWKATGSAAVIVAAGAAAAGGWGESTAGIESATGCG